MFRSDIRKKVPLKGSAALEQVPREIAETVSLVVCKTIKIMVELISSWQQSHFSWELDETPQGFLPSTVSVSCFNSSPLRLCGDLHFSKIIHTAFFHSLCESLRPQDLKKVRATSSSRCGVRCVNLHEVAMFKGCLPGLSFAVRADCAQV